MIALFAFVMSFLVAAVYFFYRGAAVSRIADETYSWPETEGTITESYIHTYEKNDDGIRTWYETVIRYSYLVDGNTYTGNSITLLSRGPNSTDRNEAASLISDFPAGMPVRVYYDPQAPQTAILIKQRVGRINGFTGAGVFCVIIWVCGVIGLVSAVRDER